MGISVSGEVSVQKGSAADTGIQKKPSPDTWQRPASVADCSAADSVAVFQSVFPVLDQPFASGQSERESDYRAADVTESDRGGPVLS